jgi:hypothetical protein
MSASIGVGRCRTTAHGGILEASLRRDADIAVIDKTIDFHAWRCIRSDGSRVWPCVNLSIFITQPDIRLRHDTVTGA